MVTASSPTTTFETTQLEYVYHFHNTMREMQLMLAYQGDVSQQLTKAFASMAEESMAKDQEEERIKRKVFHVMVESLQNLSKHSDHRTTGQPVKPGQGIFMVSRGQEGYSIVTGNVVANEKVPEIRERLNHINSLDAAELKAYYKTCLRESRLSEKGGAGLGFIDMAKKTGSKVEFQFVPLNQLTSFFLYRMCVKRTG